MTRRISDLTPKLLHYERVAVLRCIKILTEIPRSPPPPNTHILYLQSVAGKNGAAPRAPFWISFRGPNAVMDKPEHQNREVGNVVQHTRWITYHDMTMTEEIEEMQANGNTSSSEYL